MTKITNPLIEKYLEERRSLVVLYARKEIDTKVFDEKMEVVNKNLDTQRQELLKTLPKNSQPQVIVEDNKIQQGEEKMVEKEKVSRANSNAQLILAALQLKGTKSYDDVVKYVVSKKPGVKESSVKAQAKSITKMIAAGNKRFLKYKWDEATFKVTPVNTV